MQWKVIIMLNSRDINLLRSDVAANCRIFIERCKAAGFPVLVTSTVRDKEYQTYLYEQGRTRNGSIVTNSKVPTFHWDKAGLAFDICKNVKGQEYSDQTFWKGVSAIGKEMGFTWGGDWKSFVDKPHFQWDDHGKYTGTMIKAGKFPPKMPLYEGEDDMVYYKTINDVPKHYKPSIQKLIRDGILKGTGNNEINVSEDFCRIMTVLDRKGLL